MQVGPNDPANQPATNPVTATESVDSTPQHRSVLEQAQENPLLPSLLLAGGVLLMIIIMFRALRKGTQQRRVRDRQTPSPAERIAEIHQRAESSMRPAEKLMVDAESVARRLGAQLDNKAARLELLLEEADRKLEQLNRTLAAADRATPSREHAPQQPARNPRSARRGTIDPSVLDRARIDQDLAERTGRTPTSSPNSAQDQINERILHLADDGLGCVEIARTLNQPIGQVELVLNLRKSS